MSKTVIGLLLVITNIWAIDIPIDEVEKKVFKESIKITSQVIQLSSATSSIMARLGGKVIKYSVTEGDKIQKGQLLATIESIELASQIAELKGLKIQLIVANKNYKIIGAIARKVFPKHLQQEGLKKGYIVITQEGNHIEQRVE